MKRLLVLAAAVVMAVFAWKAAFCEEKDFTEEKIIAIATTALTAEGVDFQAAEVIYDQGGKLWDEKTGYLSEEDKSPNHGILRKGFLKNYRVVYFDFKEPLKDIWVFVDKDSGEVLEVYKEK